MTPIQKEKYSRLIKEEAVRLGFLFCGFSKAGFLEEEAPKLEKWLLENRNGQMGYMENHFDKRLDPTLLVEGTKTVISVALNYFSSQKQLDPHAPRVSSYAFGKDYHRVVKKKLKALHTYIQHTIGEVGGRAFVDSAPIMDKAWAAKGGLGWRGKHTNLIHKRAGSYFFLGELLLDIDLCHDLPVTDHCGTCTRCMDACPTQAITAAYELDARKCISYLTIELKEAIPTAFKDTMEGWAFGCDICQDVCPWNRFSQPHAEPELLPLTELMTMKKSDWEEITVAAFDTVFKKSALRRAGHGGFKKNIDFLKKK